MYEPIEGEKQCTHCHEIKPLSQFTPRADRPGGLHPYCKPCRNQQAKDRAALGRRKDRGGRQELWPRKLREALLDVRASKWRYPVAPAQLAARIAA